MKFMLISFVMALSVHAKADYYKCSLHNYEDYSFEIDMTQRKAAFFDNDSWYVADLYMTSTMLQPFPQDLFGFLTKDESADFVFNDYTKGGYVLLNNKTLDAFMCQSVEKADLNSFLSGQE